MRNKPLHMSLTVYSKPGKSRAVDLLHLKCLLLPHERNHLIMRKEDCQGRIHPVRHRAPELLPAEQGPGGKTKGDCAMKRSLPVSMIERAYFSSLMAACAAASLAIGTRKGLQET